MNTWIFQGNPTKFNVDEYLLDNDYIWWSIRQEHLAKHIQLNDEVFIWRSDGGNKGSGGIIARTQITSLPQDYTNDDESAEYWYEDVSGDRYLAVELKVLEVELINGINRLELKKDNNLSDLKILRLKQNTNYQIEDEHSSYLRQLWYNKVPVKPEHIHTRFPLVTSLEEVIVNMKQFERDIEQFDKLNKQISNFQQWYYLHDEQLLAPSKFIGYQGMKGHMYIDKDAIAWTDGRTTVNHLKQWFVPTNNLLLRNYIEQRLDGHTRKEYTVNILKSEVKVINKAFSHLKAGVLKEDLIKTFHQAMLEVYENAKAIGYTPTKFLQMVANKGGLQTAKQLINGTRLSDGFAILAEKGRLDLTVEAVSLEKKFRPLFTDEELETAKSRLMDMGYEIEESNEDERDYALPPSLGEKSAQWLLEIIESLKVLGGSGTLEDIYLSILERGLIELNSFVDYKSQIRKHIYLNSSDCEIFRGSPGDESDLFYSIEGKGQGFWGLRSFSPSENNVSIIEDDVSFIEGKRKLRTHLVRERNPKIINLAKERFKEKHGRLFCEVCNFDFFKKYGELGEDFIEGHHTIPVSELEDGQSTRVEDIALVCSNCHKMLHRRRPWLNKMKLKEIIK